MAKTVECMKCGREDAGIPKKLVCSNCNTEYVHDGESDLYFLKYAKCDKCKKMSGTITSKRVCDRCGAKYVYDQAGYLDGQLYVEGSLKYAFVKTGIDSVVLAEVVMLFILLAGLLSQRPMTMQFALILLAFAAVLGFDLYRRWAKAGFDLSKAAGMKRAALSQEAEGIRASAQLSSRQAKAEAGEPKGLFSKLKSLFSLR